MSKKIRIDDYLVDSQYLKDKDEVLRYVMAGKVFINEQKISSPALKYNITDIKDVRIKQSKKYSSRGGIKLQKAIEYWNISFKDKNVLDVGSSTGGFTSCALLNGAQKVSALDVGTNQLSYDLRINNKVKVYEQTNFRTIPSDFFKESFDIITMDVSFISVKLLLENVKNFLKDEGVFICLIKPQFEADKNVKRNKDGVILDVSIYEEIINSIKDKCQDYSLKLIDYTKSPIKGQKGNIEYLAIIKKESK